MKKAVGCSAQIVLLVVVAVLIAVPLACVATATAPIHSPKIAEKFSCPPDTHMKAEWYRATWNAPGEQTLSVTCVDAQGNETSTLPQDGKMMLAGTWVYFPYLFIPVLVIGAVILAGLNLLGMGIGALWKKSKQGKEINRE
jgi:hypothetical protein